MGGSVTSDTLVAMAVLRRRGGGGIGRFGSQALLHQVHHLLPGLVPGNGGQVVVGALAPVGIGALGEGRCDGRAKIGGVVGNLHQVQVAVGAHHVANGRAHHGVAGGQVFGGFGGRNELRALVVGKQQRGYIPTLQVGGQFLVVLAAEVMHVGACGAAWRGQFSPPAR